MKLLKTLGYKTLQVVATVIVLTCLIVIFGVTSLASRLMDGR